MCEGIGGMVTGPPLGRHCTRLSREGIDQGNIYKGRAQEGRKQICTPRKQIHQKVSFPEVSSVNVKKLQKTGSCPIKQGEPQRKGQALKGHVDVRGEQEGNTCGKMETFRDIEPHGRSINSPKCH